MSRSTYAGSIIIAFVTIFFFASFLKAPGSNDRKGFVTLPGGAGVTTIGGYMDTLYIGIPTFLNLAPTKRRLVFKYYITDEDSLTLHGWRTKRNNVDDYQYDPDKLILKNGGADLAIPFGPKSYLGGVVLTRDDVSTIRDYIAEPANASMGFVMFKPRKDTQNPGHTYYEIYLTDYEPKAGAVYALKTTVKVGSVGANPSPPRNS